MVVRDTGGLGFFVYLVGCWFNILSWENKKFKSCP